MVGAWENADEDDDLLTLLVVAMPARFETALLPRGEGFGDARAEDGAGESMRDEERVLTIVTREACCFLSFLSLFCFALLGYVYFSCC